jgi:predicted lipoprotein with Yx(FWY)xxD motif
MKKLLCAGAIMAGLLASGCGSSDNSSSPVAADEYNASPTSPATPTEGETGMTSPGYSPSPTSPIMMAPTGPATIDAADTKLGKVLVGLEGRTLYLFSKDDKTGKSMCTGACATAWPPVLTLGKPVAGAGVKADLLGTIKRDDGMTQVTYNKHPLYYYAKDQKAGDVNGHGVKDFGGEWYAVTPEGKKAKQ